MTTGILQINFRMKMLYVCFGSDVPLCTPIVFHNSLGLSDSSSIVGPSTITVREDPVEKFIWCAFEVIGDRAVNVMVK